MCDLNNRCGTRGAREKSVHDRFFLNFSVQPDYRRGIFLRFDKKMEENLRIWPLKPQKSYNPQSTAENANTLAPREKEDEMEKNQSDKQLNSITLLNQMASDPYYLFHFLAFFSYIPVRCSASHVLSPPFSSYLLHRVFHPPFYKFVSFSNFFYCRFSLLA